MRSFTPTEKDVAPITKSGPRIKIAVPPQSLHTNGNDASDAKMYKAPRATPPTPSTAFPRHVLNGSASSSGRGLWKRDAPTAEAAADAAAAAGHALPSVTRRRHRAIDAAVAAAHHPMATAATATVTRAATGMKRRTTARAGRALGGPRPSADPTHHKTPSKAHEAPNTMPTTAS